MAACERESHATGVIGRGGLESTGIISEIPQRQAASSHSGVRSLRGKGRWSVWNVPQFVKGVDE